jgi:prepilin-type N-terminal cleavage/methylation domain-containing protein
MKSSGPLSRRTGYTLIEVLVAMSIIALAIGAASQLSLSQGLTEEMIERENHAINYGENAARLWQLGIDDPSAILLASPNSNGTLMSLAIQTPANVDGGEDYGSLPVQVDGTNVGVTWQPPGSSSTSQISFQVIRSKPDRR